MPRRSAFVGLLGFVNIVLRCWQCVGFIGGFSVASKVVRRPDGTRSKVDE